MLDIKPRASGAVEVETRRSSSGWSSVSSSCVDGGQSDNMRRQAPMRVVDELSAGLKGMTGQVNKVTIENGAVQQRLIDAWLGCGRWRPRAWFA